MDIMVRQAGKRPSTNYDDLNKSFAGKKRISYFTVKITLQEMSHGL
jgi:hypothetical protein